MDDQTAKFNREVRDIWNHNAVFWDEFMADGNDFHRVLISPSVERLLAIELEERVLEVACGNGNFARRLGQLGARVVATDFSEAFIRLAQARTVENAERIDYRVVDATEREALLALGQGSFDAVVCNMALMDMASIEPLLEAVGLLLKPGGRFVFSAMHPCFNSMGVSRIVEEIDRDGELVVQYAVKVWAYIRPSTRKGLGIIGQPEPHYYFHRPLSQLFNSCFQAGLVIDGLEEPVFSGETQANRPFSWANYPEIPPALVVRLRLMR